jgi:spore germination cell wall hydrolase CwlJ-like protein
VTYDQFILALCLWREARGASQQALAGIAAVIRNRMADSRRRWPGTIPGVILERLQFSSFNAGDPNAVKFPIPGTSSDWNAWQSCLDVVLTPLTADPTGGATNYESCELGHLPSWADANRLTATIGPFRFYKL